ncbi:MAG: nitrite/sulfite reductase [Acidobacteria bacterium]|nr:nitrite/sulfite reductase [Acidobacteriota bacterium]
MSSLPDSRTLGRARLSFADLAEIDEFVRTLERFERGEVTPDQWRAFRLVRGTYGQRQTGDVSMLRVKIPQGVLDGAQLRALADVADAYSRGFGHVTTRQNLQFHFLKLHDVEHAMRRLADAGLTTREACGNSVRNVTACPYAGVAADEVFDVTPYAEALTRHLLRHPLSSTLPRKFKIAFEGCPTDHAVAAINDIGWRATRDAAGRRGFRVTVGGGTAILCTSGQELFDFLPAGEILTVAEAILRVFHRLGDYAHKQRNRMKFLIRSLGFAAWRAQFDAALAEVRAEGSPRLPFDPEDPPVETPPRGPRPQPPSLSDAAARAGAADVRGPGLTPEARQALPVLSGDYARWVHTNVRPQRQEGYALVTVTLPLGDVTGAQLRVLADLAAAYGDGTVRTTPDQDLVLRWVRSRDVSDLYRRLAAAGLGLPDAGTLADVTSCPGAESCKLAVTQSRGLGRLLGEHLRKHPGFVAAAPGLDVKISGCPNGCGQHHIAGLGFQGSVRRLGDKVIPQYFVLVGGGLDSGGARFGRIAAKVPARRVPEAVERLVSLFAAEAEPGETPGAFFRRVQIAEVKGLLADLERITPEDALPEDYVDLGEEAEFKVETMEGACSA